MNILKQLLSKIRLYRLEKQIEKIKHSSRPALLIGSPLYWNIGDLAIAEAEHVFFLKYFSDFELIDIPRQLWQLRKSLIVNIVDENFPIFITGGGFLGDIWKDEQLFIEDVLDTFSRNKVIFFPQTVFFSDNNKLEQFMKKLQKVKMALVCLREKKSFSELSRFQSDNIRFLLVPDIVLSLNSNINNERTNDCILCFRNDKEKATSDLILKKITSILDSKMIRFCEFSTAYPKYVSLENRHKRVKETLEIFSSAKMVITDRLHGFILAVISGTPVLFFDNLTKKVSLTAEFLKELEIVCDYKSSESVEDAIIDLLNKNPKPYSSKFLEKYYISLKNNIESCFSNDVD